LAILHDERAQLPGPLFENTTAIVFPLCLGSYCDQASVRYVGVQRQMGLMGEAMDRRTGNQTPETAEIVQSRGSGQTAGLRNDVLMVQKSREAGRKFSTKAAGAKSFISQARCLGRNHDRVGKTTSRLAVDDSGAPVSEEAC
jgi:hypothetical protein